MRVADARVKRRARDEVEVARGADEVRERHAARLALQQVGARVRRGNAERVRTHCELLTQIHNEHQLTRFGREAASIVTSHMINTNRWSLFHVLLNTVDSNRYSYST